MIPHDPAAELAVLASACVWKSNVPTILEALDASDFYVPSHQRMLSAMRDLRERGEDVGLSNLIDSVRGMGETDYAPVQQAFVTADHDPSGAIRVVLEMALRRRLLAEANEIVRAAQDFSIDAGETSERAAEGFAAIKTPVSSRGGDTTVEAFLETTAASPTPWVIKGFLRQEWRTVVVAREGQGKSWLVRQFAVCASYGINPLRFTEELPVSTLIVDLENPDDHLYASLHRLVAQCDRQSTDQAPARLWRRPGGIDVRKRADRMELEGIIAKRRPELLVLGPLYKAYRVTAKDSWDLVATEVQSILDDWRARYDLTILIEDHAPKGKALVPYGSSLWLRWPEVGIGLETQNGSELAVKRWRGDRMPTDWPKSLCRGAVWPWEGLWDGPREEEMF